MTTATLSPPVERLTYRLDEVAERLGVCIKTIWREANAGRLRTIKLRGRRLVRRADLDAYLNSLSGGAA